MLQRNDSPAVSSPAAPLVATVDTLDGGTWDRMLQAFADARYEQTAAWAEPLWGASRLSRLLVTRAGMPVAAVQMVLLKLPVLDRGLAYAKFGPVWRLAGGMPDPAVLDFTLRAVKQEYADKRKLLVSMLPPPDADAAGPVTMGLARHGFRRRRPYGDACRYLVDLSLNPDEQRASLDQRWRYNLRKAEAHGLAVRREQGEPALAEFMAIYRRMIARKAFADRSGIATLPDLIDRLPPRCRPELVFARHDDRVVAAAAIGRIGDTATYLWGATSEQGLELRAGYVLHWWIVDHLSTAGARWYDLGGDVGEQGLRQFKKGLVGKRGTILELAGEWDCWSNTVSRLVSDAAFAVRAFRSRQGGPQE